MSLGRWFGPLAAVGLLGIFACSSSSGGAVASDAGDDSGLIHRALDGGGGGDADVAIVGDGTSGTICAKDADCSTGPGVNKCSLGLEGTFNGVKFELWTTPVCIVPLPTSSGNCDPAPPDDPMGFKIHYCDGPDQATSPGFCVPSSPSQPLPGQGTCLPKCTFASDGSPAVGCKGKNTCFPQLVGLDPTTKMITGVGYCIGSCTADADCAGLGTGFVCQTDIGSCTQKKVTRTKAIGDACTGSTAATSDQTKGVCNCSANSTTDAGYCTSACVVGGPACPNGWVCDSDSSSSIDFGNGPVAITMQNQGFIGTCRPLCTLADAGAPVVADAGAPPVDGGADAAPGPVEAGVAPTGVCPGSSTCQSGTIVGPDCLP